MAAVIVAPGQAHPVSTEGLPDRPPADISLDLDGEM